MQLFSVVYVFPESKEESDVLTCMAVTPISITSWLYYYKIYLRRSAALSVADSNEISASLIIYSIEHA